MLRRGPDPLELAGVLERLERLQVAPPAAGWLPGSASDPPVVPDPPAALASPVAPEPSPAVQSARARLHVRAFDPGRRGVAVLAVLALCGAGGGAWYFVRAAPHAVSADAADAAEAAPDGADAATAPLPTTLIPNTSAAASLPSTAPSSADLAGPPSAGASGAVVVDVVGKVLRPGVFTLPTSSRIVDAITAAGGARPGTDLTTLDLASKLIDGEEIFVGIPPPSGTAQSGGGVIGDTPAAGVGDAAGTAATIVDLNSATQAELETLPGVGAVTAQRILDWRTQHGRFASVSQLQQVSGIGPAKFAALAGRVKV